MDLHSAEGGQMSVGRKAQGWYLWRLGIISQVQERKNEAGQPAHSFRFAIKEITYFFSTLSFPLFPPPPFYSSFFQLPQSLTLPHHFFYHLLLLPTELQSSPAGRAGTQHPEPPNQRQGGLSSAHTMCGSTQNQPHIAMAALRALQRAGRHQGFRTELHVFPRAQEHSFSILLIMPAQLARTKHYFVLNQ